MKFTFNDGGRVDAGYKGLASDCACRSIAIVTGISYQTVYDALNSLSKKGSSRNGIHKTTIKKFMTSLGWNWTPTMLIGSGCKVHLRSEELPSGRLLVSVSRHLTAVIDGVIHDTHNPDRYGTRCVYGYWTKS